ncbi:MAG: T9SS type A sorting domain-containing protein [Ignavibacteriales bacterium]|nr:MAG: T9SS type A sorting domain-containing protein [Ignavibacteriales bacterium]
MYFTDMQSFRMYKCRYNEETKEWGVPEMFYDNGFNVTSRWYCMNFPDDTTMFVVGEEKTKLARLRDGLWYPKYFPYEGNSYLFSDGLWLDSTTLRLYCTMGTTNADLYVDYFEDTSYVGVQRYKLNISKISDSLYTLGEYQGRREKYPYLTKDRRKMVFQANYDGVFRYYISYLLVDENGDTILTSLKNDETLDQIDYSLNQNYPNPFNPITEIEFALPEQSDITLKVYDILGKEIATLATGSYSAGRYTVPFDGTSHASGVYIYKLSYGKGQSITRKMTLLK